MPERVVVGTTRGLISGRNVASGRGVIPLIRPQNNVSSFDRFLRADSASDIGTNEVGIPWVQYSGTWGILSGQAYKSSAGSSNLAAYEHGLANCQIFVKMSGINTNTSGVCFRLSNSSNYLRVGVQSSTLIGHKVVAGTPTQILTASISWTDSSILEVWALSNDILVFINGVLITSAVESFNNTETKHGLFINSSGTDTRYHWIQII